MTRDRIMGYALFIVGSILYGAGVWAALFFSTSFEDDAQNMIYAGIAGIVIGLGLGIFGFFKAEFASVHQANIVPYNSIKRSFLQVSEFQILMCQLKILHC